MTVIEASPVTAADQGERQPITPLTVRFADMHTFVGQQADNAVVSAFHHDTDSMPDTHTLFSFRKAKRRMVTATAGEFSRQKLRTDLRDEMISGQTVSAEIHLTRSAVGYKVAGVAPNGDASDTVRRKLQEMETLNEVQNKKVFSAIDDDALTADISEEVIKPLLRQHEHTPETFESYQHALVKLLNRPEHKKAVKKLRKRRGSVDGVMIDLPGLVEQARAHGVTGADVDTASFTFEFAREATWSVHDGPKSKVQKATSVIDRSIGEKRTGEITAVAAVAGHRLAGRESSALVGAVASPAGMVAAGAVGGALRAGVAAGRSRKASEIEQGYVKTAEDGRVVEDFKGYGERRVAAEHLLHGGTYYLDSEYGPPIPITKQSVQTMLADPQLYIGDLAARADEIISRIEVGDREDVNFIAYRKGHEVAERAELVEALAHINKTLERAGYEPRGSNEYHDMALHSHVTAENLAFKQTRRKQVAMGAGVGAAAAVGLRAGATVLHAAAQEMVDAAGFNDQVGALEQSTVRADGADLDVDGETKVFDADDYLGSTDYTQTLDGISVTLPEGMQVIADPAAGANKFDLVTAAPGGTPVTVMNDATITEDSFTPGTLADYWNETVDVQTVQAPARAPEFEPAPGKTASETWRAMSSPIHERTWFGNLTPAPNGTETNMTVTRVGSTGIHLKPPGGIAQSPVETLDLNHLIETNDPSYGLYFSRPDGTGIFVSAPQGIIFDPNDTTHTYQVDIAGTMKTLSSAELSKLITPTLANEQDLLALPDGTGVTTEGTDWQRIFAVDDGHIESAQRIHNPDGTWTYKVSATIHGSGPSQAMTLDETSVNVTVEVDRETIYRTTPVDIPDVDPDAEDSVDVDAGSGDLDLTSTATEDSDLPEALVGALVGGGAVAVAGAVLYSRRRREEPVIVQENDPETVNRALLVMSSPEVARAEQSGALTREQSADIVFAAYEYHRQHPDYREEREHMKYTLSQIESGELDKDTSNALYARILERVRTHPAGQDLADEETDKLRKEKASRIFTMIMGEPNPEKRQRLLDLILRPPAGSTDDTLDVLIESFTMFDNPELYVRPVPVT